VHNVDNEKMKINICDS